MKVFISADIEGVTGVTHWDETDLNKAEFAAASEQMTAEVAAACEGALEAGATEILVKDAHGDARNIIASKLPHEVRLIRDWAPEPLMMMQGLDKSFQAAEKLPGRSDDRLSLPRRVQYQPAGAYDDWRMDAHHSQ